MVRLRIDQDKRAVRTVVLETVVKNRFVQFKADLGDIVHTQTIGLFIDTGIIGMYFMVNVMHFGQDFIDAMLNYDIFYQESNFRNPSKISLR